MVNTLRTSLRTVELAHVSTYDDYTEDKVNRIIAIWRLWQRMEFLTKFFQRARNALELVIQPRCLFHEPLAGKRGDDTLAICLIHTAASTY